MKLVFTVHALAVAAERGLDMGWIERTVAQPDWIEVDASRIGVLLAFRRVPERGDRVLRVAYTDRGDERRILTAFLDRTRRLGPKQGS